MDTIKQRLRRFNGTDYDTVHLETDGSVVEVDAPGEVSILNTDSPSLGETVYFRDYPDITWQVQHIDGDYAYLSLYPMTDTTAFGSGSAYSGSTITSKCTDYLNNTIPNVAQYLEDVTIRGVTAKVFIPSQNQLNSEWDWPKASESNRICQISGSDNAYWTSTAGYSSNVWRVTSSGGFGYTSPSSALGFRPAVKVNYKQTVPGTTTKVLNTALNDKQDKLTFDATPTSGSMNPVTSGGIYTALQNLDASNVVVTEEFINPLNTDQLTAGQHDVYFTAYPDIMWHVDHIDGDYAYLGLYTLTETVAFDSGDSTSYSGSTIASKCTTFLNNTIPNVAGYLESVTVEGVTNKVFIPTYYQMSGQTGYGDTSGPVFTYLSGSATNRVNMINNWSGIDQVVWLSSAGDSSYVWNVAGDGSFYSSGSSNTYGFRPEVKVRYKGIRTTDLNTAIGDINASISEKASTPYQTRITFSTAWQGSDPYTQEVTVEDATENSRVDLHPNASTLTQLAEDGVSALYVKNTNGMFTANAIGGPPSTSMAMLATVTEVTPYVFPNPAKNLNVGDTFELGRYQVESETATTITWRVVHQTDTRSICMPTEILDLRCFDAKEPNNSDSNRKNYGNNKIGQANLIQWLNSSAAAGSWYTAQHTADQAPNSANVGNNYNPYDTKAGFLNLWTDDEIALLQDVTLTLVNNTVTDGGGTYTKTVKVWCPTEYEMGLGNEASGVNDGGGFGAFSYFTSDSLRIMKISAACAANNAYSKANGHTTDTAWYYWLGTPNVNNSFSVRTVYTNGGISFYNAYSDRYGVVPCIALER